MPGSFPRAASSTARRRCRPCSASSRRRSGCSARMCASSAARGARRPPSRAEAVEREYDPLPIRSLDPGAGLRRPTQAQAARVTPDSPALQVMTDLTRVSPATIRPQAPLAGANQFMITRGVRLLLAVDDLENVLGVITASDVLGERPMLVAASRAQRRDELTVADVMTPAT